MSALPVALVRRTTSKKHAGKLLSDLWLAGALQCDGKEQAARTIELLIKSVLQHASSPQLDWKKVAQDALVLRQQSRDSHCLDTQVVGHAVDCSAARRWRPGPGSAVAGLQRRRCLRAWLGPRVGAR